VEDEIHRPFNIKRIRNIVLNEHKIGVSFQVRKVPQLSGDQIIDDRNFEIPRDQGVRQMRPQKSRSTCNYGVHRCL
jgi:hypothetical protein